MHRTGVCSSDGIPRKGKRSALSFVAVPWAARAKAYLPGIQRLTTNKWAKIIAMSQPFIDSAAQITVDDTDGDESAGDSRGLIQISDDSDVEVVEVSFSQFVSVSMTCSDHLIAGVISKSLCAASSARYVTIKSTGIFSSIFSLQAE
jgi:hypothetical protein